MAHGDELVETAGEPAVTGGNRPLGPGDGIGRYRIDRVLGQGGMGVVYAAHDPDLDRPVALKVLRGAAGSEARTRLLREARAMAKLSHPNVITVYEVGSAGAIDFVAMELIDGKSLAEWLAGGRRPAEEVLRVFRAAARGLEAAHGAGLVHRDFKPANVLLGRNERVVVTDFGLARAFDDLAVVPDDAPPADLATTQPVATARAPSARPDAASLSSTLTRTGALLGTPADMAPEQFAGVTAGPRSDQYAFCVALWEALAGGRPFQGATIDDLRRAAEGGDTRGDDALPRRLRPILLRGMAREAADRYPDLTALRAAIDRAERRPRRLVVAATAGAAVLAGVVTVAAWPGG
ncbi:MAG TPA: serine/threonine-protein kinase, partial [Kofleriaceae bacterium]|nr:serine/threonine-protein kinase [Kofleriaceae bacterium]